MASGTDAHGFDTEERLRSSDPAAVRILSTTCIGHQPDAGNMAGFTRAPLVAAAGLLWNEGPGAGKTGALSTYC
jgi:hypothetical protein